MYHYLYKVTCKETGQKYYGRHSSKLKVDPYYKGSGLWIQWARAKGLTLEKEVLLYADTFEELCKLELELIKEKITEPDCVNVYKEHWPVSSRFTGFYHTPYGVFSSKRDAAKEIDGVSASTIFQRCVYCDEVIRPNRWTGREAIGKTWRELGWYFVPKEEI